MSRTFSVRRYRRKSASTLKKAPKVFTDAWVAYTGLDRNFVHGVIDHAESYVNGQIHTNGIENFWSLLKRGLKGTYVSVEPFHLFRYLDEQAFRYNNRKTTDATRFAQTLSAVTGKRLTYKEVTGKEQTEVPTESREAERKARASQTPARFFFAVDLRANGPLQLRFPFSGPRRDRE